MIFKKQLISLLCIFYGLQCSAAESEKEKLEHCVALAQSAASSASQPHWDIRGEAEPSQVDLRVGPPEGIKPSTWLASPLGLMLDFQKNPLGLLNQIGEHPQEPLVLLGRIPRNWGMQKQILVTDLELHHELLKRGDTSGWFTRAPLTDATFGHIFGRSLPFAEGEFWSSRRSFLSQYFGRKQVDQKYFPSMVEQAKSLVASAFQPGEQVVNFSELSRDFAFKMLMKAIFSVDLSKKQLNPLELRLTDFRQHFGSIMDVLVERVFGVNLFSMNDWNARNLPISDAYRLRSNVAALRALVDDFIQDRIELRLSTAKAKGHQDFAPEDLLDGLIFGGQLSPEQTTTFAQLKPISEDERQTIREEVLMFFFAGQETTAVTLQFLFYELAGPRFKEQFELLRQSLRGESEALASLNASLKENALLEAWLSETLRFYPAAWMQGRITTQDIFVNQFKIQAGSAILLSPYFLNRHNAAFGANPHHFDPSRFIDGSALPQQMCTFGRGARLCLGMYFSQQEMRILVREIVRRVSRIERLNEVSPQTTLSLIPSEDILVRVEI